MTAEVIYLHKYRAPTRIPPAVQQTYDDVRVEFARRVERAFFEQYESRMSGNTRPGDTE